MAQPMTEGGRPANEKVAEPMTTVIDQLGEKYVVGETVCVLSTPPEPPAIARIIAFESDGAGKLIAVGKVYLRRSGVDMLTSATEQVPPGEVFASNIVERFPLDKLAFKVRVVSEPAYRRLSKGPDSSLFFCKYVFDPEKGFTDASADNMDFETDTPEGGASAGVKDATDGQDVVKPLDPAAAEAKTKSVVAKIEKLVLEELPKYSSEEKRFFVDFLEEFAKDMDSWMEEKKGSAATKALWTKAVRSAGTTILNKGKVRRTQPAAALGEGTATAKAAGELPASGTTTKKASAAPVKGAKPTSQATLKPAKRAVGATASSPTKKPKTSTPDVEGATLPTAEAPREASDNGVQAGQSEGSEMGTVLVNQEIKQEAKQEAKQEMKQETKQETQQENREEDSDDGEDDDRSLADLARARHVAGIGSPRIRQSPKAGVKARGRPSPKAGGKPSPKAAVASSPKPIQSAESPGPSAAPAALAAPTLKLECEDPVPAVASEPPVTMSRAKRSGGYASPLLSASRLDPPLFATSEPPAATKDEPTMEAAKDEPTPVPVGQPATQDAAPDDNASGHGPTA